MLKRLSTVDVLDSFKDWIVERSPNLTLIDNSFGSFSVWTKDGILGFICIYEPTTPILQSYTYKNGWGPQISIADPQSFQKAYEHFEK